MRVGSMSTQVTWLPKSENPAPATSPTYPEPMTASFIEAHYLHAAPGPATDKSPRVTAGVAHLAVAAAPARRPRRETPGGSIRRRRRSVAGVQLHRSEEH